MSKIAWVAGATGLVGSQLLELLLADGRYDNVIAFTRKPLSITHPILKNIVLDFDQLSKHTPALKPDDVFCCLGTTMKQAGSQTAFYKVDFEYPLELASMAKAHGAKQYLLVTALGASKKSSFYYNRVKGEIEEAIRSLGFESYHIFRPSFLQGNRPVKRAGEEGAQLFFNLFGFLVPAKYKGIDSGKVARAMLAIAKEEKSGAFVHESGFLQKF